MVSAERVRYQRLNQVFDRALAQTVHKLESKERVVSCFPRYSSTLEGSSHLENCQAQLIEFMVRYCEREFQAILEERNVKVKLDELDDLISLAQSRLEERKRQALVTAKRKEGNARPINSDLEQGLSAVDQLSSKKLLAAHLYTLRKDTVAKIDNRLQKVNALNNKIKDEITELEEEIEKSKSNINSLLDDTMGSTALRDQDETLVQGLHDMVLELKENLI